MTGLTRCDIVNEFIVKFAIGSIKFEACKQGLHGTKMVTIGEGGGIESFKGPDDFGGIKWFEDYSRGLIPNKLPQLCFNGISDFDRTVYKELAKLPYGKVMSYSELSQKAFGTTNKARAVGSSMARNPFMIVIPCHRVIKSTGQLGAYSGCGGSKTKEWLLGFEQQQKVL